MIAHYRRARLAQPTIGIKIVASDNVKDLSIFEEVEVYNPFV